MNQTEQRLVTSLMTTVGNQLLAWRTDNNFGSYTFKDGGKEVVSRLDHEAEQMIKDGIRTILPGYKIWGEELGRDSGDLAKENFVLVDALDASKNYLARNPLFASQLAVFERGEAVWSIINLPGLGELYVANRYEASFCNGRLISPSKQDRLDSSLQCFGIGHTAEDFLRLPLLIKDQLAEPRHYGCAGVHYAFTACGRTDIYIAAEAAYYDAAPGLLLCEKAGLEFCTLEGGEFTPGEENLSLVVANPALIAQYKAHRHNQTQTS